MMQFLHMQGDPFHFLSNVLNSEIFSIVLIPLLIEFHNLAPSYIKHLALQYRGYLHGLIARTIDITCLLAGMHSHLP